MNKTIFSSILGLGLVASTLALAQTPTAPAAGPGSAQDDTQAIVEGLKATIMKDMQTIVDLQVELAHARKNVGNLQAGIQKLQMAQPIPGTPSPTPGTSSQAPGTSSPVPSAPAAGN